MLIKRMTGRRGSGKGLTDADMKNIEEALHEGRDSCSSSLGDLWFQWPNFEDPDHWGARVVGFDEGDCVVEVSLNLADIADHYHPDAFAEAVRRNPRLRVDLKNDGWLKEDRQEFLMLAKYYSGVARDRKKQRSQKCSGTGQVQELPLFGNKMRLVTCPGCEECRVGG